MSRRRRAEIREIPADPVYNSTLAEKFINSMMWDGKKTTAQNIFYSAMEKMGERARPSEAPSSASSESSCTHEYRRHASAGTLAAPDSPSYNESASDPCGQAD